MKEYYFYSNNKTNGPVSYGQLVELADAKTPVWCEGMDDWKPIENIPELASDMGIKYVPEIRAESTINKTTINIPLNSSRTSSNVNINLEDENKLKHNSYLVLSILSIIFSIKPIGAIGLLFSILTMSCNKHKDYKHAKVYSVIALVSFIINLMIFLINNGI